MSQLDVIHLPLPRFTGISLPLEPVINSGNPFDDFDDFVSAPLILPVTVDSVITKPLNVVIPKQVEDKVESLTSSLTH